MKIIALAFFLLTSVSAFSQNFWTTGSGPLSGNVTSIAFDPSASLIYAATSNNGIYKSIDNSNIWTNIDSGITNTNVTSVAVFSPGNIYAGTFGGGVFHSTDNGDHWLSANTGITNLFIYSLAISPNGNIYAGTGQKIFRSTNDGVSWTNISAGYPAASATSLAVNSEGHIFVTTLGSGLFRSTNNGDLWVRKDIGITNPDLNAIAVNSNGIVFTGTFNGVYRSTNNGDLWNRIDSGITSSAAVYDFTFNSSGDVYLCKFGAGVFRSTDNGNFWTRVNSGLPTLNIYALSVNSTGNILAGTAGNGVYRSINTITKTLDLKMFIQGFYNAGINKMVADTVRVFLRSGSVPYSIIDSAKAVISDSGSGNYTFSNALNGTGYYIDMRHRNSIETWSSSTLMFTSGSLSYDFRSDISRAYGKNMIQVNSSPVSFAVYGGDENQDGSVNLNDALNVSNAATLYTGGYMTTDMNGDNITDLSDLVLSSNNAGLFVAKIVP